MDGLKSDLVVFGVGLDDSTFCVGLSPVTHLGRFHFEQHFTTWSFLSLKYHPSPKEPLKIFMKYYITSLLKRYNAAIRLCAMGHLGNLLSLG